MINKIEILSPVGSFASLTAAIQAGCDSVFFGIEQLNMRARSSDNFTIEDLEKISEQCKNAKVNTYITLNTILYDHDLNLMKKIIDKAKETSITAIIIQDIAAMQYAREIGISVHGSTQLSVSNFESVKFYAQFCDTIVLAREVDLEMIKKICTNVKEQNIKGPNGKLVKIEIFIHGALCIAQSGRCQMSLITSNTSAQRGACLQECRKKYKIIDEETGNEMIVDNQYIMSPQDLCCLPFLDKIIESGVSVLKIEGRGRSPDYVYTVTQVYKEALEAIKNKNFTKEKIEEFMTRLKSVYNRGFCDGYYLGKKIPDFSNSSGSQATEERIFAGLVSHYYSKVKIAEIKLQAYDLKKGDKITIMGDTTGIIYEEINEIMFNENFVEIASRGSLITIPCQYTARKNDKVYILKKKNA